MTFRLILFLLGLASFFSGCSREVVAGVPEKDEPLYQEANGFERRNELDEALNTYLKLIENRRLSPESHLSAGLLFLNHKKDPVMANYHFRRVLELEPAHPRAELVKGQILNAQRLFLQTIPGQFFDPNSNIANREIKTLRDENDRLKRELASAQQGGGGTSAQPVPANPRNTNAINNQPTPTPTPAGPPPPSTYTVVQGDTLSSISKKIYGSANRWKDIYEANKATMSSPTSLTIGQTLRMPR